MDLDVRSLWCRRTVPVERYLSDWNSQGRYTRHRIGAQRWSNFVTDAADALHRRFGQAFPGAHDVWLVTARRKGRPRIDWALPRMLRLASVGDSGFREG